MIFSEQKSYTFAYSNHLNNFNNEVPKFKESLGSFKIASQENSIIKTSETSTEEGGGCLIATATYGSELAPQVQQLRELRDNQLLQTESGTQFMGMFNDVYYSFSPIIADYERENPYFKEAVKLVITPMISTLSLMENANSESEVLSIGISVIALNLGMYLGVPAIVVIGIRKKF
jgi:peptidyl-prolyl cis-trans isomerase B (cyclophilin B)